MPNYPTHSRWGRVGAAVVAVLVAAALYWAFETPLVAAAGAIGAAATTFVGAIFPDVDHHSSIPRRKANRALRILAILAVVSLIALNFDQLVSLAETVATEYFDAELPLPPEVTVGIGATAAALLVAGTVDPLIGVTTRRHRAWTHSVAITFALTAALAAVVWLFTRGLATSWQAATLSAVWTFYVGILIHLGLDGEIV